MDCPKCNRPAEPVEFFLPDVEKDGKPVPSCNAWFCAACDHTELDRKPYADGEFKALADRAFKALIEAYSRG